MKDRLNKFLEEEFELLDIAGLAVSVSVGDAQSTEQKLSFQKAMGQADYVEKTPLSADNIFHCASVTKLFVGTSIMLLEERGLLDLNAKVIEILPWYKIKDEKYKKITVKNLMTHTSGLGDVENYGWTHPKIHEEALKEYLQSKEVFDRPMLNDPDNAPFSYNNDGYELLGAIVSQVSGITFEAFVKENIFVPLGMCDSNILTFERTEKIGITGDLKDEQYIKDSLDLQNLAKVNMAMPHGKDAQNNIIKEEYYPYNREHCGSSTLTSTVTDLSKWASAHIHKKMLKPETYDKVWNENVLVPNNGEHVGLSWFIRKQNGYTLYGHEGTDDGFRASFWICPELRLHIIVLSNSSGAPVKKISKKIFDLLIHLL